MRYWFAFLFALCAGISAAAPYDVSAQNASLSVTGRITDGATNEPLPGATIALKRNGTVLLGTAAGADGAFELIRNGAEPGPAFLEIHFIGYELLRQAVVIRANAPVRVDAALDPETLLLPGLEIIGDREEQFRNMPGAGTLLSADDVQMMQPVGTQELLASIPGIHGFADDGIGNSRISIGVRGLNPRRSSRVLVLEDGIPVQPAIYLYPNMYYNPPAERIERVEVIKGSAAIRYGPQTMGGVVNYITSRPEATARGLRLRGAATTGTNGYFSLFSELGGWGTKTIRPELQLLFKQGDGFRENNDFRQYNGTLKLMISSGPDHVGYVKANVDYERSNATYTGLTEYSFRNDPDFNPKDDDIFEIFRTSLDLALSRKHSANLSSSSLIYLNYFDRQWRREFDVFVRANGFDPDNPDPVPWYTSGDLVRTGGGEANFGILRSFFVAGGQREYAATHRLFGASGRLHAGLRLHWERFLDDKKIGDAPDDRNGAYYLGDPASPETFEVLGQSHHYETTALAVHVREELQKGRLIVTPGARLEFFEQERVDRLNGAQYEDRTSYVVLPGVGFNYAWAKRADRALHVFGGAHRGYTPPSSGALKILRFGNAPSGLDLRSETSWNKEFGLRGDFPLGSFEATGFHLSISNIVAAGRGTAFLNLGRAQTYGVEWSGRLRGEALASAVPDARVSWTWLRTEVLEGVIPSSEQAGVTMDISGNELPYAPRHAVSASLSKDFAMGLSLRVAARFAGRVYADFENIETTGNRGDTGPLPGYALLDATIRYAAFRNMDVVVAGKNLLDRIYEGSRLHSSPGQPEAHLSSGILPGPRRQINVTVRYRY